jgi:putative ABC transport system ATP-binding protein
MYRLTDVTKDYSKGRGVVHALRGVNVVIGDGDWLAIQGPTGHGKSTLLQILGALDRPTSGTVELDGQGLTGLRENQLTKVRATSIGFIFKAFNLIPTLSAQENVEAALVPLDVDAGQRKERATQALAEVGLRNRHLPSELSGGQQQRVAIARALVKKPGVLLADEPTGNLDEGTRDEIMTLLGDLWRERGLTLVTVTHDSSVARRAQRTAIMRNGLLTIRDSAPRPAHEGITVVRCRGHAGPVARAPHGRADRSGMSAAVCCSTASADDAEGEARGAATLHERSDLVPVDMVGDDVGQRPRDAQTR